MLERTQLASSSLPAFPILSESIQNQSEEHHRGNSEDESPYAPSVPEGYNFLSDENVEEDEYREVAVLEAAMGISPTRWHDFCNHLSSLVLDKLEELDMTVGELAFKIDVPEEFLHDYLDLNSRSVLGSCFLRIAEELEIHHYTIFPRISAQKFDYAFEYLQFLMMSVEEYTIAHLLQHAPGKEYEAYFCERFQKALDLFCAQRGLTQDEGIDFLIDEHQEDLIEFSLADFFKALEKNQITGFLNTLHDPWLDFEELCDIIGTSMDTFIPIKPISQAELFELDMRYNLQAAIRGASSLESEEIDLDEDDDLNYTPQLSLDDHEAIASINGEYNPEQSFYEEDEDQMEMREVLQEQLAPYICNLITGKLPWISDQS